MREEANAQHKRIESRRTFLAKLGFGAAAGAALPFIPYLEQEVEAQVASPKRLLLHVVGAGTAVSNWFPSGGERDWTPSPILRPLAAYRDRIVICDGLGHRAGSGSAHQRAMNSCLTAGGQASVDQVIASRIKEEAGANAPPRDSLSLGAGRRSKYNVRLDGTRINAELNPQRAFDSIFEGFEGSGSGPSAGPTAEERRARREAILSRVHGHLTSVRHRLGIADQRRIDAHIQALRDHQAELDANSAAATTQGAACAKPPRDDYPEGILGQGNRNSHEYGSSVRAHFRTVQAAFACDLTRVASITPGDGANDGIYMNVIGRNGYAWHQAGHDAGRRRSNGVAAITEAWQWHAERLKEFMDVLDSIPEGQDETMLDHTLIVWLSGMRTGLHEFGDPLPVMVAGGLGLEGGRYLQLGGRGHNDLWTTVCHIMGFSDVNHFGTPSYSSGPIRQLLPS